MEPRYSQREYAVAPTLYSQKRKTGMGHNLPWLQLLVGLPPDLIRFGTALARTTSQKKGEEARRKESRGNRNIFVAVLFSYPSMRILRRFTFPALYIFSLVACNAARTIAIEALGNTPAGITSRFSFRLPALVPRPISLGPQGQARFRL